jgi:hypothetical protein
VGSGPTLRDRFRALFGPILGSTLLALGSGRAIEHFRIAKGSRSQHDGDWLERRNRPLWIKEGTRE